MGIVFGINGALFFGIVVFRGQHGSFVDQSVCPNQGRRGDWQNAGGAWIAVDHNPDATQQPGFLGNHEIATSQRHGQQFVSGHPELQTLFAGHNAQFFRIIITKLSVPAVEFRRFSHSCFAHRF